MIEIERQKKVLNMMITAHSILAGRYSGKAKFVEVLLLVASAILNAFVIADPIFIKSVTSLNEEAQRTIIAIASVTVFAISIILLQVKWKEKAEEHQKSANQLFILLQDCRAIVKLEDSEQKQIYILEFHKKYTQVSSFLAKIPENEFNKLKSIHYKKVELSKLIDRYPSTNYLILKANLFLSSLKQKVDDGL